MTDKLDILYAKDKSTKYVVDDLEYKEGNAATDLRSKIDWKLMPNETKMVPVGIKMKIPENYAGIVSSRSGLAMKNSVYVLNSCGLVDPSYRGEIGVILHNASRTPFQISKGDRIAQLLIVKYEVPNFTLLGIDHFNEESTPRGTGGFGSSGVK